MLLTNNTSTTAKRWLKILLDENDSLCTLSRPRWSWWLPSPRSWSSRIVPTRPETFPFLDLKSPERLFGHILTVLSGRSGRDPGAKAVKPFCLKLFHASQPCKDFPAFLSRIFALFAQSWVAVRPPNFFSTMVLLREGRVGGRVPPGDESALQFWLGFWLGLKSHDSDIDVGK